MSFKDFLWISFSYTYIAFVGISSAFMFLIACCIRVITSIFDKRLILLNLFSSFWASIYIWIMPIWSVNIVGRQKMDISKNYVIVSNHQSQIDILVLYRLFYPFRWISKAEVFHLPFIGWNMLLNGYIKLKRGDKDSIKQMMDQCEKLLKKNVSIIMFPEGTRSKTGLIKPFKPGAFILAKKMKKPILPLVINNTKDALPKHSLILHKSQLEVRVLDEIAYSKFKDMEIEQIAKMVQHMISSQVKEHIALEQEKYIGKQAN